ncbi:MinD/ParA family ATP-binding protein [Arthrobacter sp. AOP36-C1-22]|uniref:MinD/ParA family ATP-binding protein n=1 Tax=Arthrobacter sp. AOP36-C1-22 TaxID=3457683 RepID=UPI00264AF454|nr:MinD/ParA family protein [Micrococcaceae bacterium]MDN5823245.1 MinD/ParA family protein [Micrococcaceae bacterium]
MTQPHQNHDDDEAPETPEPAPHDEVDPSEPRTDTPEEDLGEDLKSAGAGHGAADLPDLSDWQPVDQNEATAADPSDPRPLAQGMVIPAAPTDQQDPGAGTAGPVGGTPGPGPATATATASAGVGAGTTAGAGAAPQPKAPESASQLTPDRLLEPRDREPVGGWRRLLFRASLGRVNVGDSDAVRIRRQMQHRISAPLPGTTRYVPVLSRKGGVGKTTVTTLLGMALAQIREDRVIALDANPDRGTLSDRSPGKSEFTARNLVQHRFSVDTFAKLSSYAAREGSRLHVLASDTDPRVAEAFDDADYRAVTELLSKYYSIVLTDSGTGMVHTVMKGTLEKADAVVLVSGASVDEARLASETLSWLEAHGRTELAKNAIVVINQSSGTGRGVNVEEIESHFRSRVATVVRLPHDPHLAEGSRVSLDRLKPGTRDAVMELAALVVDELKG